MTISVTVISFRVRVPVLSLHTTVVAPRVSTAGNRRTMACRPAIRATPIARMIVTAAGRPSGMAPTARAMAAVTMSPGGSPRSVPSTKVKPASTRMTTVSSRLKAASLRVSGVWTPPDSPTSRWIRPSSVSAPVATTTPVAVPATTSVPENVMFARSASSAPASSATVSLSTGTDSPVSADSSTARSRRRSSRRSAGTLSPASRTTTSPGTSSVESTVVRDPSRTTVAWVRVIAINADSAFSARSSWRNPTTTLTSTTAAMTPASTHSCMTSASPTATSST